MGSMALMAPNEREDEEEEVAAAAELCELETKCERVRPPCTRIYKRRI